MDLTKCKAMALAEMKKHGLVDWTFRFDNSTKTFGRCYYTRKQITLSGRLVMLNTEEECRSTILHEVAHALAGHAAGHGPEWRLVALNIGSNAKRCYDSAKVTSLPMRWVRICKSCSMEKKVSRRSRGDFCAPCSRSRGKVTAYLWVTNPEYSSHDREYKRNMRGNSLPVRVVQA